MTNISTQIMEVLGDHLLTWGDDCSCGEKIGSTQGQREHVADAILSIPGVTYVVLPEPDSMRYEGDEHEPADRLSWMVGLYGASVWDHGEVQIGYDGWSNGEPVSASTVRAYAAALLAAADAAEGKLSVVSHND